MLFIKFLKYNPFKFFRIQVSIDLIQEDATKFSESNSQGRGQVAAGKDGADSPKLVLIWNEYQRLGTSIYDNMFQRIVQGDCPTSSCKEYKSVDFFFLNF